MCKILTLSNASKVKQQNKLINTAAKLLSEFERHGFGYVAQGEQGLFGERSLSPSTFKTSFDLNDFEAPFVESKSNTFGVKTKFSGSVLFHGRTSTNDITLTNTHPINKRGWSLIHNGVVSNHGPDYQMQTTNDTEHLVEYLSTVGVSGIEQHLSGYYAIAAISPDGITHILRDDTATLFVARVGSIDSYIIATTEVLISKLCKAMSWKPSVVKQFRDNTYIQMRGNDILSCVDINPRGRTMYEDKFASASLGRSLESTTSSKFERSVYDSKYESLYEPQAYEPLRTDEDYYFNEIETQADETYQFKTFNGVEISFAEFMELPDAQKMDCEVYRPDGSLCCPYNYQASRWVG